MNDHIEAVRFYKSENGLGMQTIGCDYHWRYNHNYDDDFGTHEW